MEEGTKLAVVPELLPEDAHAIEMGTFDRLLTPMNKPIPLDGYEAPDWSKIPKRTLKDDIKPVYDDNGKLLYKSVSTAYVYRMLDAVFHGHNWGYETIRAEWFEPDARKNEEFNVYLQLVGPGMFRPVMGVGSSTYRPNNPQATKAKTIAAAYTVALKNAAKKLRIGADFDEDDPEFRQRSEDRIRAIDVLIKTLTDKGMEKEAKEVVRRHEPTVLLEDGSVLTASIEAENLEPIQRDLQRLAVRKE